MRTTLGALTCLALLTGCSPDTVDGTPAAAPLTDPTFIPCDDIPDDAVRALGYDPATEARDILDVKQPGWSICRWQRPDRFLSVFATAYSLAEIRANANHTDFAPVDVGGREGMSYREVSDVARDHCDVALASGPGSVLVRISSSGINPVTEDSCFLAAEAARALSAHIPAQK